MDAVVRTPVCPLLGPDGTLVDELLFGMTGRVKEEAGAVYWRLRTDYGYEGLAPKGCLVTGPAATAWRGREKRVVRHKNFAHILPRPSIRERTTLVVPLGSLVSPLGRPEEGWQKIALPGGGEGYVPSEILGAYFQAPPEVSEEVLRGRIVDTALLYRRSPYCWGGKTPVGIDCSGLTFMAYYLNGITIHRDAGAQPGYPMTRVSLEAARPGDLLFFPGHVGLYLGEGRYLHSTARSGSDGVVVNALDPGDPLYRPDLAESLAGAAGYMGFAGEQRSPLQS